MCAVAQLVVSLPRNIPALLVSRKLFLWCSTGNYLRCSNRYGTEQLYCLCCVHMQGFLIST